MRSRIAIMVLVLAALSGLGVPHALAEEATSQPAVEGSASAEASEASEDTDDTDDTSEPEASEGLTPAEPSAAEPPQVLTDGGGTPSDAAADPTETPTAVEPTEGPSDEVSAGGGEIAGPDALSQPAVDGSAVGEAEPSSAVAAARSLDPRASIGDLSCSTLTITVTLDNTRSREPATFFVLAFDGVSGDDLVDEEIRVGPGRVRVIQVPVTEDTDVRFSVSREAADQDGEVEITYAYVQVDCVDDNQTHDPHAHIGDVDCSAFTVPVTLDNIRSEEPTTFLVQAADLSGDAQWEDTFTLPAGGSQVVHAGVTEDSRVLVSAGDAPLLEDTQGEEGLLAQDVIHVDCVPGGPPQARAEIGDVNCTTRTMQVTVDNSRVDRTTRFWVEIVHVDPFEIVYFREFSVLPGVQRVQQVPVAGRSYVLVSISHPLFEAQEVSRVVDVRCKPTPANRGVPETGVLGTQLARTGGFSPLLPIGAVALLGCGAMLLLVGRKTD